MSGPQFDFSPQVTGEPERPPVQTTSSGSALPPPPGGTGTDEKEKESTPTAQEEFTEQFAWQDALRSALLADIKTWAKEVGYSPHLATGLFEQSFPDLLSWLDQNLFGPPEVLRGRRGAGPFIEEAPFHTPFFLQTPEGFNQLYASALAFMGQSFPGLATSVKTGTGSSGRRGSGGGRRLPTADEIRAQFDLEELSEGVTGLWRSLLLDEPDDPRGVARAYVEEIVRNPEQKLDFETYVRRRLKDQPRWNILYGNKPEGLSEAQYLQPYLQLAMQATGGGAGDVKRLGGLVAGATQFAGSPEQFQQRLKRTREVTGSSGFIRNFEDRLNAVSGVLRG